MFIVTLNGRYGHPNDIALCFRMNHASFYRLTVVELEFEDTVRSGSSSSVLCIVTMAVHPLYGVE